MPAAHNQMSNGGRDDDSLWLATAPESSYPVFTGDLRCDIVVVGGGITGLTTAYLLHQRGAKVALIERHRLATGTTGKTTAKVSSLHSLSYHQLAAKKGEEKARQYGEANQAALGLISSLVSELDIDCWFERAPAYTYTGNDDQVAQIEAEVGAAARLGLPASYTTETDLPYPVRAAVRFDDQAHFHPRRYCLAQAAAIQGGGSGVFEDTAALDVEEEADHVVVRTSGGEVRAEQVVLATLLPFLDIGGFFAKAEPTRSYAMAARLRGGAPRGMYLSADSPTRSLRPVRYGGAEGLVLGGPSHPSGREDHTARHYEDLEAWARDTFEIESVDYRWSAQDYTTVDSVPYVGRSPRTRRTFVATGFKKWGITNGTAAAMVLADVLSGRDNNWVEVFDASRIGDVQSIAKAAKHNLEDAARFAKDHLARLRPTAVEDLKPGQAGLVSVGRAGRRRLPRPKRGSARREQYLHPPGLRPAVERGRGHLGLHLPRFALFDPRPGDRRSRRQGPGPDLGRC